MSPVFAPGKGGLHRREVTSEGSTADIQRHISVPSGVYQTRMIKRREINAELLYQPGYRLRLHLHLTCRYLFLSFNLLPLCLLSFFFLPLLFPL